MHRRKFLAALGLLPAAALPGGDRIGERLEECQTEVCDGLLDMGGISEEYRKKGFWGGCKPPQCIRCRKQQELYDLCDGQGGVTIDEKLAQMVWEAKGLV